MDVYLIDESKNYTFHFPVNPLDKISMQKEKKYITADIIDIGEVDIPQKGKKIIEISFDTLFPKEYDASYCRYQPIPTPKSALDLLEYWNGIEQPVRLIITDFEFNGLVSISKFTPEERAGEPGDVYINITFRTHTELKIETVDNTSNDNIGGLQNNRSNNNSSDEYKDGDKVRVTAESGLNVRDGPGTEYGVIGSLGKSKQITIFRQYGSWADCYYGNHGGYICLSYVTKV